MKRLLTIFRRSLHTIAIILVMGVGVLYVSMHFNLAGLVVEHSLTEELADKLQTRITLDGDVQVDWLNQVVLNHVTLYDQHDDTLLYARRVLVAYELWPLLQHHLVLNTCQLIDFDIRANKDSLQGETNFQFIVDAFKTEDPDSESFIQHIDLNAILLRMGKLSYDVKDQPVSPTQPLDQHHIHITDFSANLHLHDRLLQAKKLHLNEGKTAIKANRFEMVLNPLEAMHHDEAFVFALKGLSIDHHRLTCKADVDGKGQQIDLLLHEFKAQGPLPSPIQYLRDTEAQGRIVIKNILAPTDSLCIVADLTQTQMLVEQLGKTQVTAHLEGTPLDAAFDCQMLTEKGSVSTQGNVTMISDNKQLTLRGHCLTPGFDLTTLLPAKAEVGTVAMDMDFDLQRQGRQDHKLALEGCLKRLDYRHHTYHDIMLKGEMNGKQIQGQVQMTDTLGDIDLDFDLDLSHTQNRYRVEGRVDHLQPMAMHLVEHSLLDSIAFSMHVKADIIAPQWTEAEGMLDLTQLKLQRGDKSLAMEPIQFEGTTDRGRLTSQMLRMEYQRDRHDHSYHIEGNLPVANELYSLLGLPLQASSMTRFEATFDQNQQLHEAWLELPTVYLDNHQEAEAVAEVRSNDHGQLLPTVDLRLKNPDHDLAGTVRGVVNLSPLEVTLQPTTFIYNNEELKLLGAHMVRTEEGNYAFSDFDLRSATQGLSAEGVVGSNGDNRLLMRLDHFELGQVFSIFDKGYLDFNGQATGNIVLSSEPQTHLKTEGLLIENFCYIDTLLGDARLDLDYVLPTSRIDVDCYIATDQQHITHGYGDIRLGERDSLDLDFETNHLPLGFINYWSGDVLQQFSGHATGRVRLYGDCKRLQLAGDPMVEGRFTHDIIGAHFHLHDTVHLEENLLALHNVTVDDCHGHPMLLDAHVTHDHLSQFGYDVELDMPSAQQGFLVMDRQQAPGRIYWGQLYIAGHATLKGGDGHHRLNLNVSTTDKSWFYLSPFEQDFTSENSNSGYSFLTFRDKATLQALANATDGEMDFRQELTQTPTEEDEEEEEGPTDIQVDMQINATDQCQVTVQLDPLAEDKLVCRGTGNLALQYDTRRDITLAGTYNITSGTYGMSMKGDLMNKVFQLQNTSEVRFSGVPSEAELMLDARYSIPSVNLTDLDQSITTLGSLSRSTVPVDCMLSVTGQLSAPQVSFDLEVKNVSEEIQAYVHNVIGTQEMLNQEVLYLLLFSKFYTPQYAQSSQGRSGSEITSFASASITSQLNQLLGHVSNNFTMGTNFKTDRGDFSDMEMDLSLSTRLLGDRLLLNGNVGYRDPANRLGRAGSSNTFIGDFDLEFLVNNSGSVRVKAYSHYNERDYSINNALTTQGIGFILRKDFKSFYDLWRRKK